MHYAVFSNYRTPTFSSITCNYQWEFKLWLHYPSISYVLKDVLEQLQEVLSFSYFPSFAFFFFFFFFFFVLDFMVHPESEYSESEYFTSDTSNDIHSPGPAMWRLVPRSHRWCESSDRVLRTFSRGYYRCRECITILNIVWKETVLVNISSSLWHLKCHWILIPTAPLWGL